MLWFKKGEAQIDPVCMMKVNVSNAKFKEVYKDKTYYFCSASCYEEFKKNPSKYAD